MSEDNHEATDLEPPKCKICKKDKLEANGSENYQPLMKDFTVEKTLYNNTLKKSACLQAKYKNQDGVALIILEKSPFKEEDFGKSGYLSSDTGVRTLFENDVYASYECFPRSSLNGKIQTDWLRFSWTGQRALSFTFKNYYDVCR